MLEAELLLSLGETVTISAYQPSGYQTKLPENERWCVFAR